VQIARGELMPNRYLAMNPGTAEGSIPGLPTRQPAFGLPATWIPERDREAAQVAGYTVVSLASVIATHLSELLDRQAVQGLLDTLADCPQLTKDPEILTEFTRQRLARSTCKAHQNEQGVLGVIVLEPSVEALLIDAAKRREPGAPLALDPKTAQRLLDRLASTLEKVLVSGGQAVLLCSRTIRAPLRRFLKRFLPQLALLSHHEIAPEVQVQSTAMVGLSDALETL
jgi:flagellar biosynthesis protein FlhA